MKEAGHRGKFVTWSRYRCYFIIVLVALTLILYNTDLVERTKDLVPKWCMKFGQVVSMVVPVITTYSNSTETVIQNATVQQGIELNVKNINTTMKNSTVTEALTVPNLLPVEQAVSTAPYISPGSFHVEYPHEYHFIVDEPEECQEKNPFLVLMVPVAPHNRVARDAVRSTWGTESLILGKVVSLFFMLALPSGEGAEKLQEQVLQESREHRDLLQSDFTDSYKNLTIKTMMMLKWLIFRCPNASYAMKIDSDMFLNVNSLVHMLLTAPQHDYMTGLVAKWPLVLRDPNSKWYLPENVFPDKFYPSYALGLGYVMSLDLPRKLVEASRHVKAIYIEDVYLGLCMKHLGIQPTDPPSQNLFQVFPVPYNRCSYSQIIATTTHTITDQVNFWKDLHKPGPTC
ncbi:beta-1,3-galactosyltransferase 2-like [Osmerus eperlanus]|uniref:beta-1,3-galactosyltransferase 2-like n=1 Tax=Osmerus eperlanus TaxID=29151 RepID=UPI002E149939